MELTGAVEGMIDLIGGGTDVEITPVITSGTKIADVSVGGVEKDLYCPAPTEVTVSQVQQSGTKIATIGVNGVDTDLYAPEGGSGGGINYSTSEIKVGTYTENGVDYDLYEKTFKGVMSSNAHSITVSDLSIMNMVTINGKIWGNGVEYILPFYSNNNYHGKISHNYISKQVWIETTSDTWTYYRNYEIHIFYTKTS